MLYSLVANIHEGADISRKVLLVGIKEEEKKKIQTELENRKDLFEGLGIPVFVPDHNHVDLKASIRELVSEISPLIQLFGLLASLYISECGPAQDKSFAKEMISFVEYLTARHNKND